MAVRLFSGFLLTLSLVHPVDAIIFNKIHMLVSTYLYQANFSERQDRELLYNRIIYNKLNLEDIHQPHILMKLYDPKQKADLTTE